MPYSELKVTGTRIGTQHPCRRRRAVVHVGLVVEDLDETVRFLALLGFDCGERGLFSAEWIDRTLVSRT
jgi:hypothetical protein